MHPSGSRIHASHSCEGKGALVHGADFVLIGAV